MTIFHDNYSNFLWAVFMVFIVNLSNLISLEHVSLMNTSRAFSLNITFFIIEFWSSSNVYGFLKSN